MTADDIIKAAEARLLELKPVLDEAERLRTIIAAARGVHVVPPTLQWPPTLPLFVPVQYPTPRQTDDWRLPLEITCAPLLGIDYDKLRGFIVGGPQRPYDDMVIRGSFTALGIS